MSEAFRKIYLHHQAYFYLILLFLNACKQTFHVSHMSTAQNVKGF